MPLEPVLIRDLADTKKLPPISLYQPPYDEDWLQSLIYDNPDLVPASEIEAAFENLVPVARELPLGSGYLDNLYFTPTGYPVLVEVKLWKNQESRRKVVVQLLEYAKEFAALSYPALNDKIRKRRSETWGDNPLFEIVSRYAPNHPDEKEFGDTVSRNLRVGRFLLLILGDGVRDEMQSLVNHLLFHSLRYAFGIVQLRLFRMPDGSYLALPDVMAKTQTIERHVTVVTVQGTSATVSAVESSVQRVAETKTSISLDGFFEQMRNSYPDEASWLAKFLESLGDLAIQTKVGSNGDTLMLKGLLGTGDTGSLIYISPPYAQFWGVNYGGTKKTASGQDAIRVFCNRVAALVPGASVVKSPGGDMDVKMNGGSIPLHLLRDVSAELKTAMTEFLEAVNASQDDEGQQPSEANQHSIQERMAYEPGSIVIASKAHG